MKKIGAAIILLSILVLNISTANSNQANLFREAIKLSLNQQESGVLSEEYMIDTYAFTAQEAGYYAFRGRADSQIRGHLYNSNLQFLYGGTKLSSGNGFFIATYLEAGQTVYIRVDSLLREQQNYTIVAARDSLPFNRIALAQSSVTAYVEPGTVRTIKIPLSFYSGNTRVGVVETTYPYMMQTNASGNLRGQAAFNLVNNELEIDVYDIGDARITLNIGPSISTTVNIKTLHRTEEPITPQPPTDDPTQPDDPDEQPSLPEETPREPQIHQGDVNLDNVVDMTDVVSLLDPITLSRFTQKQFLIADVTNNGIVDANDALMILRRVSGARR